MIPAISNVFLQIRITGEPVLTKVDGLTKNLARQNTTHLGVIWPQIDEAHQNT